MQSLGDIGAQKVRDGQGTMLAEGLPKRINVKIRVEHENQRDGTKSAEKHCIHGESTWQPAIASNNTDKNHPGTPYIQWFPRSMPGQIETSK